MSVTEAATATAVIGCGIPASTTNTMCGMTDTTAVRLSSFQMATDIGLTSIAVVDGMVRDGISREAGVANHMAGQTSTVGMATTRTVGGITVRAAMSEIGTVDRAAMIETHAVDNGVHGAVMETTRIVGMADTAEETTDISKTGTDHNSICEDIYKIH